MVGSAAAADLVDEATTDPLASVLLVDQQLGEIGGDAVDEGVGEADDPVVVSSANESEPFCVGGRERSPGPQRR